MYLGEHIHAKIDFRENLLVCDDNTCGMCITVDFTK